MVFFENHGMNGDDFFQVTQLTDFSFPVHFHRAYEMIYTNKGELYVCIDKKDYNLKKKDLIFIFPNQFHEFRSKGNTVITVIIFAPELIGDFYNEYKSRIPENNLLQLKHSWNFNMMTSIYDQKSFLYSVCSRLIESTLFQDAKDTKYIKIICQVLLYIEENYKQNCTLRGAANNVGYDYVYLSKLFCKVTNMTFTEYLNRYRISQACYLLRNTEMSIEEISVSCGYNHMKTFYRNFTEIIKMTPKKFKNPDNT